MVGIDGAGKTHIIYKVKTEEVIVTMPIIGYTVETVAVIEHFALTCWDIRNANLRPLWRCFFPGVKGLILVVDTNDREGLVDSRQSKARCPSFHGDFEWILGLTDDNRNDSESLRGAPILIFANKQDLDPVSLDQVRFALGFLDKVADRDWFIQPCVAKDGRGLSDGFVWLRQAVDARRQHPSTPRPLFTRMEQRIRDEITLALSLRPGNNTCLNQQLPPPLIDIVFSYALSGMYGVLTPLKPGENFHT